MSRVATSTTNELRERTGLGAEMIESFQWLVVHPPMRTLALTILTFNVTYGAAWSVLVLYAGERLGMEAVGFGLLTTAVAVGGLVGMASYGRLERRFSLGDIMRVGLLIETGTHLSLALATSPAVALGATPGSCPGSLPTWLACGLVSACSMSAPHEVGVKRVSTPLAVASVSWMV